jgi:dUTP pyrophosphatase
MEVLFVKDDINAIIPTKGTQCAVGYDLTAISVYKKLSDKTTLYDTGIIVQPPPGYYTEILPRSSITKTGYVLSNSVGTIDSDYRGRLLIALTRVDEGFPELTLPFTKCQLVLRRHEDYTLTEVRSLENTERGSGGFGSTDKHGFTPHSLKNSFC